MFAAAHLDNFLFLIFFAIAIIFQLLTRAATKAKKRPGSDQERTSSFPRQTPRATSRQLEETEQDRVRKFLEALGQPPTSQPPPPIATRPTYQKPIVLPRPIKRSILSPLPPLTTRPPESQPKAPAFEIAEGPPPLAPITQPEVAIPAFKSTAPQSISKSEARVDIAMLLRSTSGLRDAIILRELFGPPRSLQPLDLIGNI
jgi:hypothetical protein